jgi:hypothetical protein
VRVARLGLGSLVGFAKREGKKKEEKRKYEWFGRILFEF